jgi:hypothetical protein
VRSVAFTWSPQSPVATLGCTELLFEAGQEAKDLLKSEAWSQHVLLKTLETARGEVGASRMETRLVFASLFRDTPIGVDIGEVELSSNSQYSVCLPELRPQHTPPFTCLWLLARLNYCCLPSRPNVGKHHRLTPTWLRLHGRLSRRNAILKSDHCSIRSSQGAPLALCQG